MIESKYGCYTHENLLDVSPFARATYATHEAAGYLYNIQCSMAKREQTVPEQFILDVEQCAASLSDIVANEQPAFVWATPATEANAFIQLTIEQDIDDANRRYVESYLLFNGDGHEFPLSNFFAKNGPNDPFAEAIQQLYQEKDLLLYVREGIPLQILRSSQIEQDTL